MKNLKNLKSVDLSSTTIIGTSINVVWSIVFMVVLVAALSAVIGRFDVGFAIFGIGIVVGTIILSIAQYFGISFLCNFLIKKMKDIKINIPEMDKITEISLAPTSLMIAVISLIVSIIIYPLILFALSFISLLYPLLQIMSLEGMSWLVFLISLSFSPMFIIYAFFIGLVFIAIGIFVFNKISPRIGGLKLSLSSDGNMTKINSVDPKTGGVITGTICLVFGLIYGLIFNILTGNLPANLILIIILTFGSLIGGFIYGALNFVLYNFFAKKFGPMKLELENTE